jgi:hypothetical protein
MKERLEHTKIGVAKLARSMLSAAWALEPGSLMRTSQTCPRNWQAKYVSRMGVLVRCTLKERKAKNEYTNSDIGYRNT